MNAFIRNTSVPAMLMSVVLLAGCAFGTRQATLIYPPATQPGESSVAHAAERTAVPPRDVRVILGPFADKRSDTKTVGTVRNGFGMRTAEVVPANSVPDWVLQALSKELKDNGYTVVGSAATNDTPASKNIVVSGEILNVFCDMYFSYTGQVSFIARVSKNGKEILNKHYAGEGSAGVAWAGTGESYAQSLALALAAALRQFISDLNTGISAE